MKFASKLVPFYDEKGFDTLICEPDKGMFAIFDGMGVSEEARFASNYAKQYFGLTPSCGFETLKYHLDKVSNYIGDRTIVGTTATVVTIQESGVLQYAHVGDSRLYILKSGRIKQVTADEGVENVLYNYIGQHGKGVCQLGFIENKEWDKFLICSDGVTGDRDPDILRDSCVEHILRFANTPKAAIEYILKISSKKDDKSIIVGYKT